MLGKLLKYELKATARIFLPLYAVLLVFAAINKLISSLSATNEFATPEVISLIIYITILVGMFIMTYVVMIQRFYKNLLRDEGYLMFTLPTTSWKHIVSKLLISMMWMVTSGIAAFVSIMIIAFDKIFFTGFWHVMTDAVGNFFRLLDASAALFILEMIIAGIVGLASTVLIIYASIAIGHLFNQHRVLVSLGAFLALNTISQILFSITGAIPGAIFLPVRISSINDLQTLQPFFHFMIWYGIVLFGILSAGYFFITRYILSKRLNLE